MSSKACQYCGNPDINKIKNGVWNCSVCNKKSYEDIISEIMEQDENIIEVEWEEAKKNDWKYLLFDKNGNWDLSDDNLKHCQELYDQNPSDINHFERLLIFKLLTGKDCKDLALRFLKLWEENEWLLGGYHDFYYEGRYDHPNFEKLKNFILWALDSRPDLARRYCNNYLHAFFWELWGFVGTTTLSQYVDTLCVIRSPIDWPEWNIHYETRYALARAYYMQQRWLDAYLIFESLRVLNEIYEITNKDLESMGRTCYTDVIPCPPTVDEIKNLANECFSKIDLANLEAKGKLREFFYELISLAYFYFDQNQSLREDVESGQLLQKVLGKFGQGDFTTAFEQWVSLPKDKKSWNESPVWEVTRLLKGAVESGCQNINEMFVKWQDLIPRLNDRNMIIDFEEKLRQLISQSLTKHYGGYTEGWFEGVPEIVREKAIPIWEKDQRKSPEYNCLEFSDYPKIICKKENWEPIFKKYFLLDKKKTISKDESTSFIQQMIDIRNVVQHSRRPLEKTERKKLSESYDHLLKIYQAWEKDRNING